MIRSFAPGPGATATADPSGPRGRRVSADPPGEDLFGPHLAGARQAMQDRRPVSGAARPDREDRRLPSDDTVERGSEAADPAAGEDPTDPLEKAATGAAQPEVPAVALGVAVGLTGRLPDNTSATATDHHSLGAPARVGADHRHGLLADDIPGASTEGGSQPIEGGIPEDRLSTPTAGAASTMTVATADASAMSGTDAGRTGLSPTDLDTTGLSPTSLDTTSLSPTGLDTTSIDTAGADTTDISPTDAGITGLDPTGLDTTSLDPAGAAAAETSSATGSATGEGRPSSDGPITTQQLAVAPAGGPATAIPTTTSAEAAPGAGVGTQAMPDEQVEQMWSQVERALHRVRTTPEGHDLRLRLRPAELGDLMIRVHTDDSGISVRLVASNPAAQQILEADGARLRSELGRAGFEDAFVSVGTHDDPASGRSSRQGSDRDGPGRPGTEPVGPPGRGPAHAIPTLSPNRVRQGSSVNLVL